MPAEGLLGERIASLEAKLSEHNAREDHASEERQRNAEILSSLRDEVKAVASQQQLLVQRIEAIGQMHQVAKDFVSAAKDLPTRAEHDLLRDKIHLADIRFATLQTEFDMVKRQRDESAKRMWQFIIGALGTGLTALIGFVFQLVTKH